jgi:hypothetical protein
MTKNERQKRQGLKTVEWKRFSDACKAKEDMTYPYYPGSGSAKPAQPTKAEIEEALQWIDRTAILQAFCIQGVPAIPGLVKTIEWLRALAKQEDAMSTMQSEAQRLGLYDIADKNEGNGKPAIQNILYSDAPCDEAKPAFDEAAAKHQAECLEEAKKNEADYIELSDFRDELIRERDALKAEVAAYKSQICSHTDQINQQIEVGARLRDENARLRETLKFIAIGCFVPPDGGEPRFEDAIDAAREALAGEATR